MLDNDIYVNHADLNIGSLDEMYAHMRKTLSFTGKTLRDAVLVLCAYSFYLSAEELSALYHVYPAFSHLSYRAFSPLIREGYLVAERASSQKDVEGTARTMYAVTKSGYELANSLCQGKLTAKYKVLRSKMAKSHTYYIGYNFINLLLLGYPLTWDREFVYSGFVYGKRAKALQVDGRCILYENFGDKPFFTVYVEQDLGTEPNATLVGKYQNYASYGIMENPLVSMILFSFSQKGVVIQKNSKHSTTHPYNVPKLKQLIGFMDEYYLDDVYDAYLAGYPDMAFIEALLLKVDGATRIGEGGLKKTKNAINKAFVVEFMQLLIEKRNPYLQREFNIHRAVFSRSRLEEMVALLYDHISLNEPFLIKLRRGYQVYYLPTTLVGDRLRYAMLSRFADVREKVARSLSVFGNVYFKAELSQPLALSKGLSLNPRNLFDSANGDIYVELPCFDVGAWIRALQFVKMYFSNEPVHMILVFENKKQIDDFYKASDAFIREYDFKKSQVACLMLYDVGKPDKLFYMDGESTKRHYIRN